MVAMKESYFITATGTDLGKTWLTAGIVAACRARGLPVRALKPVMSGYDPNHPAESDAAKIGAGGMECSAWGAAEAVAEISPWRFAAPLSPDLAAAREGRQIEFGQLVGWCRKEIKESEGILLIEGIGGVMVPLDGQHTVRDWIAALELETVLVCGTYLGALSHALTALAALREVGVVPALIVVNESPDSGGANVGVGLADTLTALAPHAGEVPLLPLRRDHADDLSRLMQVLLRRA
jgi:dethiobiotin synthetase